MISSANPVFESRLIYRSILQSIRVIYLEKRSWVNIECNYLVRQGSHETDQTWTHDPLVQVMLSKPC